MIRKLYNKIKKFKPPLILCSIFAILFSTASLICVTTDLAKTISPIIIYGIYIGSAIFLFLFIWAVIIFCRFLSLKHHFVTLAQKNELTARIVNDFSFRTVTFTYASFILNIFLALGKGAAGWISSSWWLISLSAYYLILCISKFLLLRDSNKLDKIKNQAIRELKEWKVYRTCGVLFLLMTLVLFGVVVLIVTEKNQFIYYGMLIFVVAIYDFYCLINAIVYMIKTRKQHTPIIVAIKTIGFATALVSMLSLQTAMFASFGNNSDSVFKGQMNLIIGIIVCFLLCLIGIVMITRSNKKIKSFKNMGVYL